MLSGPPAILERRSPAAWIEDRLERRLAQEKLPHGRGLDPRSTLLHHRQEVIEVGGDDRRLFQQQGLDLACRSALRIEIEGREAQVEALAQPDMLQLGRQLVEERIRREMREGILALIGLELFGQPAAR